MTRSLVFCAAVAAVTCATASAAAPAPPRILEAYKVVVEPSGKLLVADGGRGGGRIFRVDPTSGHRAVVAGTGGQAFARAATARRSSLGRVTDVALGRSGAIYAVASSRVVRIDRRGRLTVVARLAAALGLAVAPDGTIYVTDDEGGRLLRLRGGQAQIVATGFDQPVGVTVGPDGSVYVSSRHRIERVEVDGTRTTVFADLALGAFVTALPDGSLLVPDHVSHAQNGKLLRVAPDGAVTVLSEGAIRAPMSAAQTASGTIYMTTFGTPPLGRVDPSTGKLVALGSGRATQVTR